MSCLLRALVEAKFTRPKFSLPKLYFMLSFHQMNTEGSFFFHERHSLFGKMTPLLSRDKS